MSPEISYLLLGLAIGSIAAWIIATLTAKSKTSEELNVLNTDISVEREKNKAVSATLTSKEEELKKQTQENTRNTGFLASAATENSNLQKQIEKLIEQQQTNNSKIEQQQTFIRNLEKYNAASEANLKAARDSIEKNIDEIKLLKADVRNKTEEFNKANEKVADLSAKNDSLSERISAQKDTVAHLEKEIAALKTNLAGKTEEFNKSNEKVADLSAKNDSLNEKTLAQKETIAHLEDEIATLKNNIITKTDEFNKANEKVADLSAKNNALNDKLNTHKEEIIELQRTSQLQFEKIANQILEEKSGKFTETNKANIEALLKPLGENIEKFKTKVEETYDKESKQRFSLEERVKELIEQTNIVSAEANNLATALKGQAKKQGNWGEMILESILQKSGLVKDREYFVQKNIKDDEGNNLRPDVLVNLPDNRVIIIDSKVSLVAYDRFSSADKSEDQAVHLTEHLKSIHAHIDDLQSKNYDNLATSLDFTMMFIPIEPAYLIAIQADQELWAYAYSKRILLISPTNLIACLKLIADLWKREMQSKNAMEIVKRGELLYEKFVGFVDSIEDVGKHIGRTQTAYNSAVSQLKTGSGNLVGQAQKLKSLGLKSNKEVSPAMQPLDFDDIVDSNPLIEKSKEN